MKVLLLQGSPRKQGKTEKLLQPFKEELLAVNDPPAGGAAAPVSVETVRVYEQDLRPCLGCRACQSVSGRFGCVQRDDMEAVFDRMLAADCLIFATPIYIWFCTGPMKILLDRFGYAAGKFYGSIEQERLAAGKLCGLVVASGRKTEEAAAPFEEAMKHLCRRLSMEYCGMTAGRDFGPEAPFPTAAEAEAARQFARRILAAAGKRAGL